MKPSPQEQLVILTAEVASRCRERDLRLNYPESGATIIEVTRDGRSVSEMVDEAQIRATFSDGRSAIPSYNMWLS